MDFFLILASVATGLAKAKGIGPNCRVTVYNRWGEVTLLAKIRHFIPDPILICPARQNLNGKSINVLFNPPDTDLSKISTGFANVAYHDTFVNIVSSSY